MRNSSKYFKETVLLLHCINVECGIFHWWWIYKRSHRGIQKWCLATTGNPEKGTIFAWINILGRWNHGHRWSVFRRQVSLLLSFSQMIIIFSDPETEIWNFTNESYKIINPTLPNYDYEFGIALYIVPFDFCTTWNLGNEILIKLGQVIFLLRFWATSGTDLYDMFGIIMFQNFKIHFLQSTLIFSQIWLDHMIRIFDRKWTCFTENAFYIFETRQAYLGTYRKDSNHTWSSYIFDGIWCNDIFQIQFMVNF